MSQPNISNHSEYRPVVGITLGDFNGVGPEVILKTLADVRITKLCVPVVYGSYKILAKYKKLLNKEDIAFHSIKNISELFPKKINLITCWEEDFEITPGKATPESGKCAFLSLSRALEDATSGKIDALLTAPINKKNIQGADFDFPGHTEYLTQKTNTQDSLMFMVSEEMRVGVVTGHIPLEDVKQKITKERLLSKINILYKSLKNDFALSRPRIAILGLNPHAGEEGLLGKEEQEIITPVINELKEKGILITGPFPADGFFGAGLQHKFDGVLAMYHDQGLTPFKALAFDTGVNYTAGLPIIRTSPDHGTAYDIAGKGTVNENSFRQALFLAIDIVKSRKTVTV